MKLDIAFQDIVCHKSLLLILAIMATTLTLFSEKNLVVAKLE